MKSSILSLLIFFTLFQNLSAQKVIEHRTDYILNAIDVFTKMSGQILVVDKITKDENGEIKSVQYVTLNRPDGIGFTHTILCVINLQGTSTSFYDVNYPNEIAFLCNWSWMSGVMDRFSFNYNDFKIRQYDQYRIVNTGGGAGKIAEKMFQENVGTINYGLNGKDFTFDEIAIISKGKNVRDREEKDRLPSYRMDYKEYEADGGVSYEYNRYKISTTKETKGKRQNEGYERYNFKRNGDLAIITKDSYSSSGELQTKTTYNYKNYRLQSSSTYNTQSVLVDSVFCSYNDLGFINTKEIYSLQAGKLTPKSKNEYTYQNKAVTENVEGKCLYNQIDVETVYNNDGTPRMQQKNDSGLYRRHFENGRWGEWQKSMY